MSNEVTVLNMPENTVPTPGATATDLSVSAETLAPTLDAATQVVLFQVFDNPVYVTFDGTTPSSSNGIQLFTYQSARFGAGLFRAARFFPQTGTSRVYITELIYSTTAARITYSIYLTSQAVKYSNLFDRIVRRICRDPATFTDDNDKALIADCIQDALREVSEFAFWPRLTQLEERTPITGDTVYLEYESGGLAELRHLKRVWNKHPHNTDGARHIPHRFANDGIYLTSSYVPATVYVEFRLRSGEFTADDWVVSTVYAVGDLVYHASTGECYQCVVSHVGQEPPSETHWELQIIPGMFAEYIIRQCQALWHDAQKDFTAAGTFISRAEKEKLRLYDREIQDQSAFRRIDRSA